jgi:hypothetical protein
LFQGKASVSILRTWVFLVEEAYAFFFSSLNLWERTSKSLSLDAEMLVPADAVSAVEVQSCYSYPQVCKVALLRLPAWV